MAIPHLDLFKGMYFGLQAVTVSAIPFFPLSFIKPLICIIFT